MTNGGRTGAQASAHTRRYPDRVRYGGVELAVMISNVLAVENRKKVMTLSKQRISRSKGRSVSKGRNALG
jgi:hypothetical protein